MKRYQISAAITLGLLTISAVALAHGGGDMPRPFLQRHALMSSLAAHMKAAKLAIDANELTAVETQANAIHWLARMLPDVFPEGSGAQMGKTRAAPAIWSDWSGFVAASDQLATSATGLKKAAASGDAASAKSAFGIVGREGCGGCHKRFRTSKR